MGTIGGAKRENNAEGGVKKVGLFVAEVLAINPTEKEFKDVLGIELKEGSKAAEYFGERDGNTVLRLDFWVKQTTPDVASNKPSEANDEEGGLKQKITYFLEDKVRLNKEGSKTQYINSVGMCTWATDESLLPTWFVKGREYRKAYHGEEDLYEFLRNWLNKLDYRNEETELTLDWKKLMKGDLKDIKSQIGGEWAGKIGCMATVIVKEVEGEIKEYQGIYNRAFFSQYNLKYFRLIDYDNDNVKAALLTKDKKDLKTYERFVLNVTGEYGCKDFYNLKDIKEYDPNENPVATNAPITEGGADY
jgi:hypothetical protein